MQNTKYEMLLVKTQQAAEKLHVFCQISLQDIQDLKITEAVHYCAMQLKTASADAGNDHSYAIVEESMKIMEAYLTECYLEFYNTVIPQAEKQYSFRLFEEHAKKTPNKIAIDYASEGASLQLSYQELNEKSNQIARKLIDLKTQNNWDSQAPVALYFENSPEVAIMLLAIWKAGLFPLLLTNSSDENCKLPTERLVYYIEIANPVSLVLPNHLQNTDLILMINKNKSKTNLISFNTLCEAALSKDKGNLDIQNDVAYMSFSSGSAGVPKYIKNFHFGLPKAVFKISEIIPQIDKIAWYSSLVFDATILDIVTPLILGKTLVPVPKDIRTNSSKLEEYLSNMQVDLVSLPPVVVEGLSHEKLAKLNIIITGEDPSEQILKLWHPRIYNGYGPNERSVATSIVPYHPQQGVHIGNQPVSGKWFCLTPSTEECKFPNDLNIIQFGGGELYLSGLGLGEYIRIAGDNSEHYSRFRAIIHPNSAIKELIWVYQTGDIIEITKDNNFKYVGRTDYQYKYNGVLVHPGSIERAMSEFKIDDAEVFSKVLVNYEKDSGCNPRYLVAYLSTNYDMSEKNLRQLHSYLLCHKFCNMAPHRYIEVENAWPVNERGKIIRNKLKEIKGKEHFVKDAFLLIHFDDSSLAPITVIVRKVWNNIFNFDEKTRIICLDDNFYEIGGNSILAYRMISEIKNLLPIAANANLNIGIFNRSPTIRDIVNFCRCSDRNTKSVNFKWHSYGSTIAQKNLNTVMMINSLTGDCENEFRNVINLWPSQFPNRILISASSKNMPKYKLSSLTELAEIYVKGIIDELKEYEVSNLILMAFSAGGNLAIEVASQLENHGIVCGVVCIDTRSVNFYKKISQAHYSLEIKRLLKSMASFIGFNPDNKFEDALTSMKLSNYSKPQQLINAWTQLKESRSNASANMKEKYLDAYVTFHNMILAQLNYDYSDLKRTTLISFTDTANRCKIINGNIPDPYLGFEENQISMLDTVQGIHEDFLTDQNWVMNIIVPKLRQHFDILDKALIRQSKFKKIEKTIAQLRSNYINNSNELYPMDLHDSDKKSVLDLGQLIRSKSSVHPIKVMIYGNIRVGKTAVLNSLARLITQQSGDAIVFYLPLQLIHQNIKCAVSDDAVADISGLIALTLNSLNIDSQDDTVNSSEIAEIIKLMKGQCWYLIDDIHLLNDLSKDKQKVINSLLEHKNVISTSQLGYHLHSFDCKSYTLEGIKEDHKLLDLDKRINALTLDPEIASSTLALCKKDNVIRQLLQNPICSQYVLKFLIKESPYSPSFVLNALFDDLLHRIEIELEVKNKIMPYKSEHLVTQSALRSFLKKLAFYSITNHKDVFDLVDIEKILGQVNLNIFNRKSLVELVEKTAVLKLTKSNDPKNSLAVEFISSDLKYYYAALYIKQSIFNAFVKEDANTIENFVNHHIGENYSRLLQFLSTMLDSENNRSVASSNTNNAESLLSLDYTMSSEEIARKVANVRNVHAREQHKTKKDNSNKDLENLMNCKVMLECIDSSTRVELEALLSDTKPDRVQKFIDLVLKIVGKRADELDLDMKNLYGESRYKFLNVVKKIFNFKPKNSIIYCIDDNPDEFNAKTLTILTSIVKFDFSSEIKQCLRPNSYIMRFKLEDGRVVELNRNHVTGDIEDVNVEWFENVSWYKLFTSHINEMLIDLSSKNTSCKLLSGRYVFEESHDSTDGWSLSDLKNYFTNKHKKSFTLKGVYPFSNCTYLFVVIYSSKKISQILYKETTGNQQSNYMPFIDIKLEDLSNIQIDNVIKEVIPGLDHSTAETCFKIEPKKYDSHKEKLLILKEIEQRKKVLVDYFSGEGALQLCALVNEYIDKSQSEINCQSFKDIKIVEEIHEIVVKLDKINVLTTENALFTDLLMSALYCYRVNKKDSYMTSMVMSLLKGTLAFKKMLQQNEIIAFIGNTGVGKSTAIAAYQGFPMCEKLNKFNRKIVVVDKKKFQEDGLKLKDFVTSVIGHLISVSETSKSECFKILDEFKEEIRKFEKTSIDNLVLVDSTGRRDTRGIYYDLAGALSFDQMIKSAKAIRAIVLTIRFETFHINRGELVLSALENLSESFPKLFDPSESNLRQSIFLAVTHLPDYSVDNAKKIERDIQEFIDNCQSEMAKHALNNDKNRLEHESHKMQMWQFLKKLNDNDQILLLDPTNDLDNRTQLASLVRAPGVDKKHYNYALNRPDIANVFAQTIHMTLHTWRSCIMQPYLEDMPKIIKAGYEKIQANCDEVAIVIESTRKKKTLLLDLHDLMINLINEIKDFRELKEIKNNSVKAEKLQKKLKNSVNDSVNNQILMLKRMILEIQNKINGLNVNKRKTHSQSGFLDKRIAVKQASIEDTQNSLKEMSTGDITEILASYGPNNPNDNYTFHYWKPGAREKAFKEVRSATAEDFNITDKVVLYKDLKFTMGVDLCVERHYVLVPSDPAQRKAFLDLGRVGEYVAEVKGHNFELDLGRNATDDSKKVIYSFKLTFDGTEKMPEVCVSHTWPKKDRFASNIANLQSEIDKAIEDLNKDKIENAQLKQKIAGLNSNIEDCNNDIAKKEQEIKDLEANILLEKVEDMLKKLEDDLHKRRLEFHNELEGLGEYYEQIDKLLKVIHVEETPNIVANMLKMRQFALIIQKDFFYADLTRDFANLALSDYEGVSILKDKHGDISAECKSFVTYYENNRDAMLDQSKKDIDISLTNPNQISPKCQNAIDQVENNYTDFKKTLQLEVTDALMKLNAAMRSANLEINMDSPPQAKTNAKPDVPKKAPAKAENAAAKSNQQKQSVPPTAAPKAKPESQKQSVPLKAAPKAQREPQKQSVPPKAASKAQQEPQKQSVPPKAAPKAQQEPQKQSVPSKAASKAQQEPQKQSLPPKVAPKAQQEPQKQSVPPKVAPKAQQEPQKQSVPPKVAPKAKQEPQKQPVPPKVATKAQQEPRKQPVPPQSDVKTKRVPKFVNPASVGATLFKQGMKSLKAKVAKSTLGDGNCYFHGSYGTNESGRYVTPLAQDMRLAWSRFLDRFTSCGDIRMPKYIKNALEKVFMFHLDSAGLDNQRHFISILRDEIKTQLLDANSAVNVLRKELRAKILQKDTTVLANLPLVIKAIEEMKSQSKYAAIKDMLLEVIQQHGKANLNIDKLINGFTDVFANENASSLTLTRLIDDMLHADIIEQLSVYQNKSIAELTELYSSDRIKMKFVNDENVYKAYIKAVQQSDYYVYIEEIPVLATLSRQKITVHFSAADVSVKEFTPSKEDDANVCAEFWPWESTSEVSHIYHQGLHFSKYAGVETEPAVQPESP